MNDSSNNQVKEDSPPKHSAESSQVARALLKRQFMSYPRAENTEPAEGRYYTVAQIFNAQLRVIKAGERGWLCRAPRTVAVFRSQGGAAATVREEHRQEAGAITNCFASWLPSAGAAAYPVGTKYRLRRPNFERLSTFRSLCAHFRREENYAPLGETMFMV